MGPENLSHFVEQFKRVLSEQSINSSERPTRFCHRERVITPYRLAVSVLGSCATTRWRSGIRGGFVLGVRRRWSCT